MIRLVVWITLPSGESVRCGVIICTSPDHRGRINGSFRYAAQWLNHPESFALDPNELLLTDQEYVCDHSSGIFQVFEDSLPDDWGRRLLVRKAKLGRGQQSLAHLLLVLNGAALGALSFFPEAYSSVDTYQVSNLDLETLVEAALNYEAGIPLEYEDLQMLFAAASSPGGARPKALVRTDDGEQWIAKFPSTRDVVAMVPVEAATLSLAKKAGLEIPDFRIETCGKYKVLLIKRFDLTQNKGRRHLISFQTLLKAEGHYTFGYIDLFAALRKLSARPAVDIESLFRQMVFNAFMGNTDDHLKNFSLLHDNGGYYLSPAYDLLPDTADRREHVLHFSPSFAFPGEPQLLNLAKAIRIPHAASIVAQVKAAIIQWQSEFDEWGVPDQDIRRLSRDIERRVGMD